MSKKEKSPSQKGKTIFLNGATTKKLMSFQIRLINETKSTKWTPALIVRALIDYVNIDQPEFFKSAQNWFYLENLKTGEKKL